MIGIGETFVGDVYADAIVTVGAKLVLISNSSTHALPAKSVSMRTLVLPGGMVISFCTHVEPGSPISPKTHLIVSLVTK